MSLSTRTIARFGSNHAGSITGYRGIQSSSSTYGEQKSLCISKISWLKNNEDAEPIVGSDSFIRHVSCGTRAAPSLERITSTLDREGISKKLWFRLTALPTSTSPSGIWDALCVST